MACQVLTAQIPSWDMINSKFLLVNIQQRFPPSTVLFLCTKGAWRPGVFLAICDAPTSTPCHSCREPDIPQWCRRGEAPPGRRHEEHQAVAGRPDGQLQGERIAEQAGWAAVSKNEVKVFPSKLGNLSMHPGVDVQRAAGRDCGSTTDREVPAYRQLDRSSWL